jgi:hypothetical protein
MSTSKNFDPVNFLLAFLCILAISMYILGICIVCTRSLHKDLTELTGLLRYSVTVMAGALSVNFGAVTGIAAVDSKSQFRNLKTWIFQGPSRLVSYTTGQVLACYVYVASLFACLIVYAICGFNDSHVLTIIVKFSEILIGISVGAVTLILKAQADSKVLQTVN